MVSLWRVSAAITWLHSTYFPSAMGILQFHDSRQDFCKFNCGRSYWAGTTVMPLIIAKFQPLILYVSNEMHNGVQPYTGIYNAVNIWDLSVHWKMQSFGLKHMKSITPGMSQTRSGVGDCNGNQNKHHSTLYSPLFPPNSLPHIVEHCQANHIDGLSINYTCICIMFGSTVQCFEWLRCSFRERQQANACQNQIRLCDQREIFKIWL
jgi:hypothetical protein